MSVAGDMLNEDCLRRLWGFMSGDCRTVLPDPFPRVEALRLSFLPTVGAEDGRVGVGAVVFSVRLDGSPGEVIDPLAGFGKG